MGDIERAQRPDAEQDLNARPLKVRTASSIAEVPATDWDDCARGDARTCLLTHSFHMPF